MSDEQFRKWFKENTQQDINESTSFSYQFVKDAYDAGHNNGYHDAEEHYMNVIDEQHKLVDKSRKDYAKYVAQLLKDLVVCLDIKSLSEDAKHLIDEAIFYFEKCEEETSDD